MLKLLPTLLLFTMATLMACSEPATARPPGETTAQEAIAAATALPPNTLTTKGGGTAPTTTSTETPTERPTAAPRETAASSPTPESTAPSLPRGVLVPLRLQDPQALLSVLSDTELACIGDDPDGLARAFTGTGPGSRDERERLIGCLEDETIAQLFIAGFVPGSEPLSLETSTCLRSAFEVIDPRRAMTAGIEGDPERAMAASMTALFTTMACLNDEEWEVAAPKAGVRPNERAGWQCLMEALGGPGQMAEAIMAAQEGDATSLSEAGTECGLDMGPEPTPMPPPGTPTPAPAPETTRPTTAPTATTTPPTSTTTPTTASPPPAATSTITPSTPAGITLVIAVAAVPADIPEYSRSEWRHWTDADGDCQDARQEVLIAESLDPVTYETDRECRVEAGRWWAPYLAHHLGNPSAIDVDHHVPLKNAHLSGGWTWTSAEKQAYANYLGEENHLVALSARHNRSKGARGPDEWRPPSEVHWCQYSTDWVEIKDRWELTMTETEAEAVMEMLETCEVPPHVEVLDYLGASVGVHKPTPESGSSSPVYGSCEDAAAAGEARVQGNSGGRKGFPAEMVPSARDGDGDGVVCEQ